MPELINKNVLYKELIKRKEGIRGLLPIAHQPQAERFIAVAITTFVTHQQKDKLEQCTVESVCQAVMDAATCGFALDNKFVYVIPYLNKKYVDGKEVKVWEAQAQFDYKALIALARRPGTIEDVRAQIVYEKDEYDAWEENGKQFYKFRQARGDRGKTVLGAYAVAIFPSGGYRFAWMDFNELEKVHKASKSPSSPAWTNWRDRMYAKAAVKRVLVGLQDDPGLVTAIELDNREYDMDKVIDGKASEVRVRSYDDLADHLEATVPGQRAIEHQPEAEVYETRQVEHEPETVAVQRTERAPAKPATATTRASIGNHPTGIRG
jgi:phage RecT family recombinase